jgi:hypothetical protein
VLVIVMSQLVQPSKLHSLTRQLLLAKQQRILQPPISQPFNVADHCKSNP